MKEATAERYRDHMRLVVPRLLRQANVSTWDGRTNPTDSPYFMSCVTDDRATLTRLILTRDVGHHASGWLKNPDYERCYHLSMSTWGEQGGAMAHTDHADRTIMGLWAKAVFDRDLRYAWVEGPKSPEGKLHDVWHWRLFCDEHWQPILPRKEVYSMDFTELGWRSASQVQEEDGVIIESILYPG